MNIINKIKSWLVSDDEILRANGKKTAAQAAGQFVVPPELTSENIHIALQQYGREAGSAILAKVKRSNLIAQGVFQKLLKKSGPEYFYREVAAMAGNKYGDEDVEALHQHVQRAAYLLLLECNKQQDSRNKVIECAKAMYMYGLSVTLKENKLHKKDSF